MGGALWGFTSVVQLAGHDIDNPIDAFFVRPARLSSTVRRLLIRRDAAAHTSMCSPAFEADHVCGDEQPHRWQFLRDQEIDSV
jgi:hypothetical protein